MGKRLKHWLLAGLLATVNLIAIGASQTVSASGLTPTCHEQTLSVPLSATDPTLYHIAGWLCWQGASAQGKTVQLLIHGATYDHNYWDWPQQPQLYSYVQTATASGFATFAIDRLGDGMSDHPANTDSITVEAEGYEAHQIVQMLRSGSVQHVAFSKVMLVGHSFGSGVSLEEAGTYHDVDGVVITGSTHSINPAIFAYLSQFYPAIQDPKFQNSGLPAGYLTTEPGIRTPVFFNPQLADPAVIAKDEQLKQTTTTGEVNTLADALTPTLSQAIHVPVLVVVGQDDAIFCGNTPDLSCNDAAAIKARESAFYAPQACLETSVVPGAGHDINLHYDAQAGYAAIVGWSYRRVGNGIIPPAQPCQ